MAVAAQNTFDASRRRFVYGANVLLVAVLAIAAVVLAVWAAGRFGGSFDMSSAGSNSLSERSRKLVRGLNEDVTVTGLYSLAAKDVRKFAEKHYNRLRDLLDLYENAGGGKFKPRMIDPQSNPNEVAALLARLKEKPKYKDESAPHQAVLKSFPELQKDLSDVMQSDVKKIEELAKADPILNRSRELFIQYSTLSEAAREVSLTGDDVKAALEAELPGYGRAIDAIKKMLPQARTALQGAEEWMATAQSMSGISAEAQSFFATARERYQPLLGKIDEMIKQTQDLKKVEIEDLYNTLKGGNTVVIETPEEARVLRYDEVWSFRGPDEQRGPDEDDRQFTGERAISSAILQLTQKERTGVIFVRVGGEPLLKPDFSKFNPMMQQLPQAPFGKINQSLTKENFETAEWDVAAEKAPPKLEKVARTILVVLQPEPPPQNPNQPRPPMGITPDQKKLIEDAVNSATAAIFLANWPIASSQSPFGAPPYEFNDYLKSVWGIEVKTSHLTVQFAPNPQAPGLWGLGGQRPPVVTDEAFSLTSNPILEPVRSSSYGFWFVCPVMIAPNGSRPSGVKVEPLINTAKTENVWAVANFQRLVGDMRSQKMGTKPYDDDILSPYPVAVVGDDGKHRLVVFGSQNFIGDEMLDMAQAVLTSGGIAKAYLFPGNADLFISAVHWAAGEADRIAVGPASGDVPRLSKLTDESASWVRTFLVGVWPALALVVGGVVWFVRRR